MITGWTVAYLEIGQGGGHNYKSGLRNGSPPAGSRSIAPVGFWIKAQEAELFLEFKLNLVHVIHSTSTQNSAKFRSKFRCHSFRFHSKLKSHLFNHSYPDPSDHSPPHLNNTHPNSYSVPSWYSGNRT